jgi:hypothetical protein
MAPNNFGKHLFKESNSSLRARELAILRAWHTRTIYEWHYHGGYALNPGMTLDEVAAIGVGPGADGPGVHGGPIFNAGWAIAAFGIQLEEGVDKIGFNLKTRSGMPPIGRQAR